MLTVAKRLVNKGLALFEENLAVDPTLVRRRPPVFVLGPPRSGTTLLYQLLVEAFDVGYITNLHCYVFGAPALLERVLAPSSRLSRRPTFDSRFGKTPHLASPAECGEYWYQFFPRNPVRWENQRCLPDKQKKALAASVARLTMAFDRSLVFKNVMFALRINVLAKLFDGIRFIVLRRDLLANAHSLLKARKTITGSYSKWWSVPVPGLPEITSRPPHEQVVEQIRGVQDLVRNAEERWGESSFLTIDYESLCADVDRELSRVHTFFDEMDLPPRRRDSDRIPDSLEISSPDTTGVNIAPNLFESLKDYVPR